MLARTAQGLFWMFRYLERSENTARLLEAGARIAITRWEDANDEWGSILTTTGTREDYLALHPKIEGPNVIDFLLREPQNPSSVYSSTAAARTNARAVRTALTREVWEAVNEAWMSICEALKKPVADADLPAALNLIRQQSALVRGSLYGTMLRNDIYDFARLGTFLERADSTARILDVKYYVLLPSVRMVGSQLDNIQWETILRSVSAYRSYKWLNCGEVNPTGIAEFLIFDRRLPRSLAFCTAAIAENLGYLAAEYGEQSMSLSLAEARHQAMRETTVDTVMETGLHEYLTEFLATTASLTAQIEADFRFNG